MYTRRFKSSPARLSKPQIFHPPELQFLSMIAQPILRKHKRKTDTQPPNTTGTNMTFGFQVLMHKIGRNLPPHPNSPIRRDKAKEPSDTDDRRHPRTSHEDPEWD